jgi:glycosyltransferase involved in cell wall biosynthesis
VGSLKDEIVEGKTGLAFQPEDPIDLARAIEQYFTSDLYADLDSQRQEIKDYANERHSWGVVSQKTMDVYAGFLRMPSLEQLPGHEVSDTAFDAKIPS